MAALQVRYTPLRLTPSTSSHRASDVSSTVPYRWMPALVTTMSRPPKRSTAVATSASTSAATVTSARTPTTLGDPSNESGDPSKGSGDPSNESGDPADGSGDPSNESGDPADGSVASVPQ